MESSKTVTFPYSYKRVGGRPAIFSVREGLNQDIAVIREVGTYAKMDVNGKNVLDIGGNIGAYTVLASQLGAAFIKTIEPDPENYELLCRNVERNSQAEKHLCLNGAAISSPDTKEVYLYIKNSPAMNSLYVKGGTRIAVPAYDWQSLLSDKPYQALKIDCEGGEYDLLLNGGRIPNSVDSVFMEIHLGKKAWRTKYAQEILQLFSDWRCRIQPNIGEKNWVTLGFWER